MENARHIEHTCQWDGCHLHGEYQAPSARQYPSAYVLEENPQQDRLLFCLEHVREYNNSWDFFAGMSAEEIVEFQKDAVVGHRPTGKISPSVEQLQEKLGQFQRNFGVNDQQAPQEKRPIEEVKSLKTMNLSGVVTRADIKKQYKKLVKRYHPDINQQSSQANSKFIAISEAYQYLLNCGKFS